MDKANYKDLFIGLAVATVAFLVYANSLGNAFVGDDHSVILNNPLLKGSLRSLFEVIDTTRETERLPFYRPLTYLSFQLEGQVHGFRPLPMHLVNVLLHGANAFLVYRLARGLFKDYQAPLLVGLLFAVHPLHSEGVNFLAGGRNTLLACFFILAAYLTHRRSMTQERVFTACAGALLFGAGLFTKEISLMIFPFIATLELSALRQNALVPRVRSCLKLLPYVTVLGCYLLLRWSTLSRYGIQTGIIPGFGTDNLEKLVEVPGLYERLQDNFYIIPKYLLTVIWPTSLSPRYIVPADYAGLLMPLIGAWFCIIAVVGYLLTRGRSSIVLVGMAWFTAFWLPVSGIVYFSDITMADRFLYVPAIGLWLIAADQAERLLPHTTTARRYALIGVTVMLMLFSASTFRRNLDWKNDLSLYSRLVIQYPENPHGHYNLASAYIEQRGPNDLELAEQEFIKALALDPAMNSVYSPLGYIRLGLGDFSGALLYYDRALTANTLERDARINRGIVYARLGKCREALADFQFYLTIPGRNNIPGSIEYVEEKIRELALTCP